MRESIREMALRRLIEFGGPKVQLRCATVRMSDPGAVGLRDFTHMHIGPGLVRVEWRSWLRTTGSGYEGPSTTVNFP